ncbi:xylose isomerase-like protein [Mycena belliarum]|uniref:Xylose isomerase-like protein n=1 Tax=Mycena belliarum TaxID=1033014 RepID=A0AAD6UEL9_9AGAR|nr:xylose isomerase-like protein [Mycena belliae]
MSDSTHPQKPIQVVFNPLTAAERPCTAKQVVAPAEELVSAVCLSWQTTLLILLYQMTPKFAISSLSLGNCAHHQLPTKIRAAASLGYDGIEIFIPDFEAFVNEVRAENLHHDLFPHGRPPTEGNLEVACAKAIASLCDSLGIAIPVLQPLRGFENFSSPNSLGGGGLAAALEAAERWLRLMPHLNAPLLLVCSNHIEPEDHPFAPFDPTETPLPSFATGVDVRTAPPGPAPSPFFPPMTQEQLSTYLDIQVDAFRALGKRAARYGVRVGYESLAWGTVVDNWEQVWDVVRRVGRDNVGIILDSFNCLGNQYADPTVAPTFLRSPASCSQTPVLSHLPHPLNVYTPRPHLSPMAHLRPQNATHSALLQNLALLARTVPGHKIFLYQLADAASPCSPSVTPRAPARMTWSRAARLFPCEDARGAWLPVADMSLAVVEAGYPAAVQYACGDTDDAWWSLEVYNASLMDPRAECVPEHAARGILGLRVLWERVCREIGRAEELADAVNSPATSRDSSSGDESESGMPGFSSACDSDVSDEFALPTVDARVGLSSEWSSGRVPGAKLLTAGCIVG